MTWQGILVTLLIGLVAGWLGSLLVKGKGSGLILNLVIGVIGAFLGGWIFSLLGISTSNLVLSLLAALVGSVILLLVARAISKK